MRKYKVIILTILILATLAALFFSTYETNEQVAIGVKFSDKCNIIYSPAKYRIEPSECNGEREILETKIKSVQYGLCKDGSPGTKVYFIIEEIETLGETLGDCGNQEEVENMIEFFTDYKNNKDKIENLPKVYI